VSSTAEPRPRRPYASCQLQFKPGSSEVLTLRVGWSPRTCPN